MEYASIEREIHVEASPEVVFEVISSPVHLQEWWPDEAELEPVPGAIGELAWDDGGKPRVHVSPITVVDVEPPRVFSFRWIYPEGEAATSANSLLVTFELTPASGGTTVRMTEVGFREKGWEAAVLEELYDEHCVGWDLHIPRLGVYVDRLVSAR